MPELTPAETEKALSLPLGAMSPLWFVFAGAATAGAAWFWARTWFKPTNLEAMASLPLVTTETLAPVIEAAETVVETTAEAVAETVEAAPDVAEEVVETVADAAPDVVERVQDTVETVTEPVVEGIATAADDLTRLSGIGPKLAQSLAERGVTRFAEIAAWTAEDVARFDKDMKLMGRVEREAWIVQAKRFAEALH